MGEAYERKLRPIYDALDGRNFKTMLKLSTAALQKYEDDQLLRALKAWALVRVGKSEESAAMCDKLVGEVIVDEHVLHVCSMVMRSLQRPAGMTAAYEAAAAARPKDVGLLTALFNAYVRDLNFVKQQQVAVKLQKLDGAHEGLYAWWAIVSVALQAKAAKAGKQSIMSAGQLLQLAQSLAEKRFAKQCGTRSYEAVMLYVGILREQDKLKEAVAVLEGDLGIAIQPAEERLCLLAQLLAAAGDCEAAARAARKALEANPDSWQAVQLCLDCLLPSTAASQPQSEESHPASGDMKGAVEAVEAVRNSLRGSSSRRTAVLADVDLELRRHMLSSAGGEASASGREDAAPSRLASAVLRGFQQLGHKISCAADLRPYAASLNTENRRWMVREMKAALGHSPSDQAGFADVDALRRSVAAYQIECDVGMPEFEDAAAAAAHAATVLRMFKAAAPLCEGLDEKERGPADELPCIATAALVAAWKLDASGSPKHLLQALAALEGVQRRRKVTAGLRIAAAGLYSLLAAPLLAEQQLAALEIKHIQHDTLSGHLHLPALLPGLCKEQAERLVVRMSTFYDSHEMDRGESLMLAYTSQSYTKVLEFEAFNARLEASCGRAFCNAESSLMVMLTAARKGLEAAKPRIEQITKALAAQPWLWKQPLQRHLHFNEDLSVRPAWLPPSPAGPLLAVADWWESAAAASPTGAADCWWSRTLAAAARNPGADAYREAATKTLRRRLLLPQLLQGMLGEDGASWPAFQDSYAKLLQLEGLESSQVDAWLAALPAAVHELPLTQLCQALDTALFATVHASKEGGEQQCSARCGHLSASYDAVRLRLSEVFSHWQGKSMLPVYGPGWAIAANLVYSTAWAALWLQARDVAGRTAKKAKKGAGKAGSDRKQPLKLTEAAAAGLRQALLSTSAGLKEAGAGVPSVQKVTAALEKELQLEPWVGDKEDLSKVLRRLNEDQLACLRRSKEAATEIYKLCSSTSFTNF